MSDTNRLDSYFTNGMMDLTSSERRKTTNSKSFETVAKCDGGRQSIIPCVESNFWQTKILHVILYGTGTKKTPDTFSTYLKRARGEATRLRTCECIVSSFQHGTVVGPFSFQTETPKLRQPNNGFV
jgi:hypothetical protein